MAFPDDLLEQAYHLARREKKKPKQASLRRAVSCAYYALFHLLISDAVANWKSARQRSNLARAFEHGRMKSASEKAISSKYSGHNSNIVTDLRTVAKSFIQLQQQRHRADYDNSIRWTRTEALSQIGSAATTFKIWQVIRTEEIAQDYLLWFLVNRP